MPYQRPPQKAPPPQKKGLGCFGCGCLLVIAFLLLCAGFVAGGAYFLYKGLLAYSSTAPAAFAPYNGSDDITKSAQTKLATFNQAVGTGHAATLALTADEINTLLAHDPDLARLQVKILVSMNGDQARLQGTIPADSVPYVAQEIPGRFMNVDATFGLSFNADTKLVEVDLHKMQIGDETLSASLLPSVQAELAPWINLLLQAYPNSKNALAAAKSVSIKDGQLVIETK